MSDNRIIADLTFIGTGGLMWLIPLYRSRIRKNLQETDEEKAERIVNNSIGNVFFITGSVSLVIGCIFTHFKS